MKKSVRILIAAFVICVVVTVLIYPAIPDQMPMQFSLTREVNYTFPKYIGVSVIPLLALSVAIWKNMQGELDMKNAIMVACLLVFNCCFIGFIAFAF